MGRKIPLVGLRLVSKVPKQTKKEVVEITPLTDEEKGLAIYESLMFDQKKSYKLTISAEESEKLKTSGKQSWPMPWPTTQDRRDMRKAAEDFIGGNAKMAIAEVTIQKVFNPPKPSQPQEKPKRNWTSDLEDSDIRTFLRKQKDVPGIFDPLKTPAISKLMKSIKAYQQFSFGKSTLITLKLIAFVKATQNKRFKKYKSDLKNVDTIIAIDILKDCVAVGIPYSQILKFDITPEMQKYWALYNSKKENRFEPVQTISTFDPIIKWSLIEEDNPITIDNIIKSAVVGISEFYEKDDTLHIRVLKLLGIVKQTANAILYNQSNLSWDMDNLDLKSIRNFISRSSSKTFVKMVEKHIKYAHNRKELKPQFMIDLAVFLKKGEIYSILKNKVKAL